MRKKQITFLVLLVGLTVLVRIEQWLPNVSPMAALALWVGANYRYKISWLVPIGVMMATDAVIGFYNGFVMVAVYGSFVLTVWLGDWLKGKVQARRIVLASLGSSGLFYLITNAAVWWFSGMYEHTMAGLALSYYYAIPFFRNTVFGNLAYSCGVFLVWSLVLILWPNEVAVGDKKMKWRVSTLT